MEKELKDIETKLRAINSIIAKLDPAIKLAAFEVLKSHFFGCPSDSIDKGKDESRVSLTGDVRDFYASFNPPKPARLLWKN